MNIVLFGGAFNPPHIGHLIVIQQALELIKADQLWLLPCYQHTFDKDLASPRHRLEMLKLLVNELPGSTQEKVRICPLEIDYKLSGETYQALKKLKSEKQYLEEKGLSLKQHKIEYSFLMGADNLESFEKWQNWQELIETTKFYIYPRNGHQTHNLYKNMELLKSNSQVVTNFSSTIMRKRIKQKLSLKNFVPDSILGYLSTHSLY